MNKALAGAIAGAAATIPMSWAMEVMHRALPHHESQPLPPREITERLTAALGIRGRLSREQQLWLALASHLGYGAAAGALYASALGSAPFRALPKGVAYGVALWAVSYLGLLPALNILSPATRHPPRRNALMIAAHLVFGSALGVFAELVEKGVDGDGLQSLGAGQGARTHPREAQHV